MAAEAALTDVTPGTMTASNRWVSRVFASPWDAGTAFVAKNGFRNDDFAPYLYRTTDYGRTWTAIAANLPRAPINVVVQDRRNRSLLVVGNDIAAHFRASDRLSRYDLVGLEGTPALRDAVIGSLSGSPVVEHNGLEPDEGYYLHGTSFVLANAAPDVPRGAVTGNSGISKRGIAVRWIQDYDANYLRDRSIVSTFMGINEIRDERDADGNWIVEEGEFDDEELAVMKNKDGSDVAPVAVGTRKNVRIVKLTYTGAESVLA